MKAQIAVAHSIFGALSHCESRTNRNFVVNRGSILAWGPQSNRRIAVASGTGDFLQNPQPGGVGAVVPDRFAFEDECAPFLQQAPA